MIFESGFKHGQLFEVIGDLRKFGVVFCDIPDPRGLIVQFLKERRNSHDGTVGLTFSIPASPDYGYTVVLPLDSPPDLDLRDFLKPVAKRP